MAERKIVLNEFGFKTMVVQATWGRDNEKVYKITEWPAARAEEWAVRALIAYQRGGGELPVRDMVGRGMEAIVALGIETFLRGHMQAAEIIPIYNELLECVEMIRDPSKRDAETGQPIVTKIVSPTDIMEIKTRGWLRSEVIWLHTGFSPADAISSLISAVMKVSASSITPTSAN